jgi:hypothetical protein
MTDELDRALSSASERLRSTARDAFNRMPDSHKQFARDIAEVFGKPSAVRLVLDGKKIYEHGTCFYFKKLSKEVK